jgi:release factor H-coupled RctB family protein
MDKAIEHRVGQPGARIIATPEVWLEGEAERQLAEVAAYDDCAAAVGMPDLHPGPGIPIGAAFGFRDTVHPRLVGGDAGCGALVVSLGTSKLTSSLERRVRSEFEDTAVAEADREALCDAVWRKGPRGLAGFGFSDAVEALVDAVGDDELGESGQLPSAAFGAALGTIGRGNHFAELGRVTRVVADDAARAVGVRKGGLVLLCHSGSRGLGKALADRWGHASLPGSDAGVYLAELAGAVRFARANRILIAARMLEAIGIARQSKIAGAFDVVHNSVGCESCGDERMWVHRKGCAPAHDGQLTVVLGSRGAPSWIMRGSGNPAGLSSVAHGAGRKMRRSEARDKIRARYRRSQLRSGKHGGLVICDDVKLLYEEHPDAYKAIEPVIESLERARLAERVASIEPVLTVKK